MVTKLLHNYFLFILDLWNISKCGVKQKRDVLGSSNSWRLLLVTILANKSTKTFFGLICYICSQIMIRRRSLLPQEATIFNTGI